MPSRARLAFDENARDIDRLFGFHLKPALGGGTRSAHQTEVLNKSAVVLLTAYWEAYCEDVAAEGVEHLVSEAADAQDIPVSLRKRVAKELEDDVHELSVWRLAGDSWRDVLRDRLAAIQAERNRRLNTPKASQIDALFKDALGIPRISESWTWRGMSADRARQALDDYVTLRGEIAHRGQAAERVSRQTVKRYVAHVRMLVGLTGGQVSSVVEKATGKPLWVPLLRQIFSAGEAALITDAIQDLSEPERHVLSLRLGTDLNRLSRTPKDIPEHPRTLAEVGSLVNLPPDEVLAIESRIFKRLNTAFPEPMPGDE